MIRAFIWFVFFGIRTLVSMYSLLLIYILEALGKKDGIEAIVDKTTRSWARSLVLITGSKVEVEGAEFVPLQGPVLFVANHQGNFDIPLMLGFVPGSKGFIAKIELEKFPIISTWMRKMHCVFLDRGNMRKSLLTMREATNILKEGHSLVVFPEGTRGKGKPMREFKRGSLGIAEKAKVPIIPVTIIDSYKIMEGNAGLKIKPAKVKIHISKPIQPGELEADQDLTNVVRLIIQEKLTGE
ncbi:MAG: lysophospholipid acyltransferase family protein [Desulfitobacteriaceae bacterium]